MAELDSTDDSHTSSTESNEKRPYAEVRRFGRWRYSVLVIHDIIKRGPGGDPWVVWGHNRALRKGKKELKKYIKWLDRTQRRERIDP